MSEKFKQVHLAAHFDDTWGDMASSITCWVEDDPRVKEGAIISLKDLDPGRKWKVVRSYDECLIDKSSLYKPWRVGGLE